VPFTKRDNVELVVNRNQGSDDPVDSGGLVGQTDLRRRCTLNRLSTNNSSLDTLTETSAAEATIITPTIRRTAFFAATDWDDMETSCVHTIEE
jgi:hypothetical protein